MVLIGLLVVAVVSLVLGLTLTSTVWLIVSLAASVVAAVVLALLVRAQRRSARPVITKSDAGAAQPAAVAGKGADAARPVIDERTDVLVVDGEPDYHRVGCARLDAGRAEPIPRTQASEDGFSPCAVCRPGDVRSEGEAGREPELVGASVATSGAALDAASRGDTAADGGAAMQAAGRALGVGDGPEPPDARPDAPEPNDLAGGASAQVWVADGYPEYHVRECGELRGLDAEPIPHAQAVEDGFQPCVVCDPDAVVAGRAPSGVHPDDQAAEAAAVPARDPDQGDVWVVDGQPEYHRMSCARLPQGGAQAIPHGQAVEDGFAPCTVCAPDRAAGDTGGGDVAGGRRPGERASRSVWVVDGRPDYHLGTCTRLSGLAAEQIPYEQAVEDGFMPCDVCQPDEADSDETPDQPGSGQSAISDAAGGARDLRDVWVVDGFPDYHRPECPQILGLNSEPVPHTQAAEDGFTPCEVCRPDDAQPPHMAAPALLPDVAPDDRSAASPAVPAQVWVVDGFPDFHRSDCRLLVGQPAEQVPGTQAVEDEFTPCAVCDPLGPAPQASCGAVASPDAGTSAPVQDVWVVDGFPEYHRADCRTLAGLDDEPVPHDQAVEDGFTPCEICRPDDATAPEDVASPVADDAAEVDRAAAEQAEREAAEAAQRDQTEREAAEAAQREQAEAAQREQAEREAAEQAEREQAEQAEREQAEQAQREQAEREAAEQAEREQAEAAQREQAEREAAEQAEREQAERKQAEAAQREQAEREATERDAAEQAEREQAEQAQREQAEREATERGAAEQAEREQAEQAQREQAEREAAEQAERERAEREAAEQEQAAANAVAEPVAEPEPVTEPTPEPTPEPASEPAVEPAPEPVRAASVETTGAASGSARRVWVLDGRPRFHTRDCLIIKGQNAQPLPFDDAVEQGFQPCSLCSRD